MSSPAIEIVDLRVCFADRRAPGGVVVALNGVSLNVPRGAIFGFLGPNGAGKTTTIQTLLGFIPITGGTVRMLDRDVQEAIARERVGYLPEPPSAYGFVTAREWLEAIGRLFGLSRRICWERAGRLLDELGLADAACRRVGTFSRGMRQRLGLAQALVNDPDLLILDEPTSGMDPLGRIEVRHLLRRLKAEGKTVFFSSHELSEVELLCDQIAILSNGRVAAQGKPVDLCRPGERLEQAFLRWIGASEVAP